MAWILGIIAGYIGFVLFLARMCSWKWHPDKGGTEYDE